MKPGTYKVTFVVNTSQFLSEEEAKQSVAEMCSEMLDDGEFPDLELELVEELDLEYNTEEDEVQELSF